MGKLPPRPQAAPAEPPAQGGPGTQCTHPAPQLHPTSPHTHAHTHTPAHAQAHAVSEEPPSCHSQAFLLPPCLDQKDAGAGDRVTQRVRPRLERGTSACQHQGGLSSSSALMQPRVALLSEAAPEIDGWSQQAGRLPEVVLGGQSWGGGGTTRTGAPRRLGTRKEAIGPCLWETAGATWWPWSSLVPGMRQAEIFTRTQAPPGS